MSSALILALPVPEVLQLIFQWISMLTALCPQDCHLSVVDHSSKMTHFVPLPKVPSAKQLSTVFIQDVVRHHGIPTNILSGQGS